MAAIGIDFGTTNCVVSVFEGGDINTIRIGEPPMEWGELGHDLLFPSVFGLDDRNKPLFGWEAKLLPPKQKIEAIKRFFFAEEHAMVGSESFTLNEISTYLFAQLRKSAARESGVHFDKSVVTIPANSRGNARKRTKVCAGMANIKVLALINEPTAAAMAATKGHTETVMVVDWGGGTLDVTVLETRDNRFVERTSAGVSTLGGVDFDTAVMGWLSDTIEDLQNYSQAEKGFLRLEAERAKILLSTEQEVSIRLPRGDSVRLSRLKFEELIQPLLQRAREPVERCLEDVAKSGMMSDIDSLVLVGGTSQIPAVRDFIAEIAQLPLSPVANPMTATAEGAAVASAILQGEMPDYNFQVTTQHALGVLAVSHLDAKPHFSTIIPRNQGLPARGTERFAPVVDHQEWLNLAIMEGDPTKSPDDVGSVELQHWRVPITSPKPMAECIFDITYRYDTDGIVHVDVSDPLNQTSLLAARVPEDDHQEKRKLVETSDKARAAVDGEPLGKSEADSKSETTPHPDLPPYLAADIIMIRTKVAPFLDMEESAKLLALCDRIVETQGADDVLVQALHNFHDKYSYLI